MAYNDLVDNTESMQYFPDQPSMPDYKYQNIPSWIPQDAGYLEGEEEPNEVDYHHIIGALRECLEEIDIKGKELFKEIVSDNMDLEMPLGKFIREAIGDSRGKDFLGKIATKVGKKILKGQKDGDFVVTERGIDDEELNQKLERFKVKTVNIGGGAGNKEGPK